MRFLHPHHTLLSSKIFHLFFWLKRWNLGAFLQQQLVIYMQMLAASCALETPSLKTQGPLFSRVGGQSCCFFFWALPRSMHEHLTLQDLRSKISVFNECLKILLVKAVLVGKPVELCIHLVMLLLASQWLSALWILDIKCIWIPAMFSANSQLCSPLLSYAAFTVSHRLFPYDWLMVHWSVKTLCCGDLKRCITHTLVI